MPRQFIRSAISQVKQFRATSLITITVTVLIANACSHQPPDPVELRTLEFEPLYLEAISKAQEWRSDAYLHGANLPVGTDQEGPEFFALFGFYSVEDRDRWLLVTIQSTNTGGLVIESEAKEFELPRPEPNPLINIDEIISSQDALDIMQEEGAGDFVADHGFSPLSTLALEYSQPYQEQGPIIWRGTIGAAGGPRSPSLRIELDAGSSEVLSVSRDGES